MALLNTWASQQDQATLSPLDRLLNNYIQQGDAPLAYLMRGDAQGLLKDLNTPKPVNTTRDMTDLALNLVGSINPIGNVTKGLLGSLDDVIKPYKDMGIDISAYVSKNKPELTVSKIVVPKEMRSQGIGTQVMQDITNYADQTGNKVTLTPSTSFGATSVGRLKDFYKNLGFVENKGKLKDFSTRETMYREPKGLLSN
jgi:predicted GNAT family acetyltransferase